MRSDSSPRGAMNTHRRRWSGGAGSSTSRPPRAPNVVLVQPWRTMSGQNCPTDGRVRSTTRPPTSAIDGNGVRPVTWNMGHGAYTASSPLNDDRGMRPMVADSCAHGTTTPLAGPVVPDVYRTHAGSAGDGH